ncbi:MAG: hypothetical protein J7518_18470 [Nocardioidaceae bacterium]|nr:hypothetical protein [Nocardioidaceae bacterium]
MEMYWSDPNASCASVAREVGCSEESVRRWVHQAGPGAADRHRALAADPYRDLAARLSGIEATLTDLEGRVSGLLDAPDVADLRVLF